jgi:hypothetical protein
VDGSFGLVTHYESFLADPGAELDRVLAFLEIRPSPAVRDAVLAAPHQGARHQRRTAAEVEASGLSAEGRRLYAALRERGGPVYREVQRRESEAPPPAAPPPAPGDDAGPRSHAEEIAVVTAVLEAREAELASIKPVLVARDEEVAGLKALLAARDGEIAARKSTLAARDRLGTMRGVLAAFRRRIVPPR